VQYFHRTSLSPDTVAARAATWFGSRLAPTVEELRLRVFSGSLGTVRLTIRAEGGHYTLVTASTDQPGESELDKFAKRFLGELHAEAEPTHVLRGFY
jgi:hypothetical protein